MRVLKINVFVFKPPSGVRGLYFFLLAPTRLF